MTRRRHLLWLLPLLIALALIAAVLALPRFVASRAHRATIEALASSLTGRQVIVAGPLSLALLPAPRLIASDVTIGGPAGETITARSLTLDVALPTLLRGRLAARSLTLQAPRIVLPWPLPGGAAAVVPPPWLATLHAQMSGATISVGRLTLTDVDADLFTAGSGALSIAGTGKLTGIPLTLSLGLAPPDAAGVAALTVDSRTPDGKLGGHFSGTLQGSSAVAGGLTVTFALPGESAPVSGTAEIVADAGHASASDIQLTQGTARLTGTADLNFAKPAITLDLAGDDIDATPPARFLTEHGPGLPGTVSVSFINLRLPIGALPQLRAAAEFGPEGVSISRLNATLPGGGGLDLTGRIDAVGGVTAEAALSIDDLSALVSAFQGAVPLPPTWRQAELRAVIAGSRDHLTLTDLNGSLGASHLSGSVALQRTPSGVAAGGVLHFDRLDLVPLIALFRQAKPLGGFSLSGEVTVDQATYQHLSLQHLLLDAALDSRLIVHRLSAALYGGATIASFTLAADGQLAAAQALLAVPSAMPLAALLPAPKLPAVMLAAPLKLSVAAAGPPDHLATSAVASLGDYSITAAPVLDLSRQTATGPLTLRHPDAIAALAPFGLDTGLAWPGAGSISLRADVLVSPAHLGVPDFVLSFGDFTANGGFLATSDDQITADIAADTLALPPLPDKFRIPWEWMKSVRGKIGFTANRVWLGGQPILEASAGDLKLNAGAVDFTLAQASLGDGKLSGVLTANTAGTAGAAPALGLRLNLANADAAGLGLPIGFPYTLPAGTLSGQAALTASGFSPAAWAATLGGSASLNAVNGQLAGFVLANQAAPAAKPVVPQQPATTPFTSLAIAGSFSHGVLSLQTAMLQGPDGAATATGSIDIPDHALALHLTLSPINTLPATQTITSVGNWAAPKQVLSH